MQLNHDQLQHLLALLGESDIQELKLEGDDFRLEVRRNLPSAAPTTVFQASTAPAQVLQAAAPCPLPPRLHRHRLLPAAATCLRSQPRWLPPSIELQLPAKPLCGSGWPHQSRPDRLHS